MMPLSDEAVLAALPGVPISRDNVEHYRGLLDRRLLDQPVFGLRVLDLPPPATLPAVPLVERQRHRGQR